MSKLTYFNTASCGLVAPEFLQTADELYSNMAVNGSTASEEWRFNTEPVIRQDIADFMGVSIKNVAMIPNFSWAMNAVVQSLKGIEKVLLYKNDFPSVTEPFRVNKFDIVWVEDTDGFTLPIQQIQDCIKDGKVDMVVISHVMWQSGYTLDIVTIGKLCKEYGVIFIVDATQSLGSLHVDIATLGADVFISSNYKWMNAGFGTGVLYMSGEFIDKYPPVVNGFGSYAMLGPEWRDKKHIRCYEPGHTNLYGLLVLQSAMRYKMKMGLRAIQEHNLKLAKQMVEGIAELPVSIVGPATMKNRCSIIVLKDEQGFGDWLKQNNIVVTQRNGLLRISAHYYNTEADILHLLNCIKEKFST
jgi:cysteine desulfurase/selenocysteine lyase